MTDNKELKRLAEAAPTGPWISENDSLYFKDDGYTRHLLDADAGHDVEDEAYYVALNFIAAANPAVVLALIAENERLEGEAVYSAAGFDAAREEIARLKSENERLENDHGNMVLRNKVLRERPDLAVDRISCHDQVNALQADNERLKAENEALRREREGKVLCDLELFETLRDSAITEADEHRQCMATYRPLRQDNLDSVVKKCDDLLAAISKGEQS